MARAGVLPGLTQPSQTAFIAPKFFMSAIQMLVRSSLGLVRAGEREQAVDFSQNLLGLGGDIGLGIIRDDAREINRIAVNDGLGHARADFDPLMVAIEISCSKKHADPAGTQVMRLGIPAPGEINSSKRRNLRGFHSRPSTPPDERHLWWPSPSS